MSISRDKLPGGQGDHGGLPVPMLAALLIAIFASLKLGNGEVTSGSLRAEVLADFEIARGVDEISGLGRRGRRDRNLHIRKYGAGSSCGSGSLVIRQRRKFSATATAARNCSPVYIHLASSTQVRSTSCMMTGPGSPHASPTCLIVNSPAACTARIRRPRRPASRDTCSWLPWF